MAAIGLGAKPDNQPTGWRNLSFGMSFDEAVDSLGDLAQKKGPLPPGFNDPRNAQVLDFQGIAEDFGTLLKQGDSAATGTLPPIPKEMISKYRKLLSSSRTSNWVVVGGSPTNSFRGVAELAQAEKYDGRWTRAKLRTKRGQEGTFAVESFSLAGKKKITDAIELAKDIALFLLEQKLARHGESELLKIQGPSDLLISDVDISGLAFAVEPVFQPNLVGLNLKNITNTVQTKPGDVVSTFEEISRDYTENLGEPTSTQISVGERSLQWDFPTLTVVVSYRKDTRYTLQYINGQDQLAPSTTEVIDITYRPAGDGS